MVPATINAHLENSLLKNIYYNLENSQVATRLLLLYAEWSY